MEQDAFDSVTELVNGFKHVKLVLITSPKEHTAIQKLVPNPLFVLFLRHRIFLLREREFGVNRQLAIQDVLHAGSMSVDKAVVHQHLVAINVR